MSKDNPFKIVLEYDLYTAPLVEMYKSRIKKAIDAGVDIPAQVLKDFYALFKTPAQLQQRKIDAVNKITKDLLAKFNKYKYNFEYVPPPPPSGNLLDSEDPYSLQEMLQIVLWEVVDLDGRTKFKNRSEFIYKCWSCMNDYKRYRSVPDKKLKPNKIITFSAYLAASFDFIPNNLSPTQLRNTGRNSITSYEREIKKIAKKKVR